MLLAILLAVLPLTLTSFLFSAKINKISGQLETFESADYTHIYMLNYDSPLENEWIYVDTDVMVYSNPQQEERIGVSCLMCQDESLKQCEASVSQNVADTYSLKVGDTVFVVFPFTSTSFEYSIKEVSPIEFDYRNPNVDNNIGIMRLGLNQEYIDNTRCKYISFSKGSQASELSEYPQIIESVVTKQSLDKEIFFQGLPILIILFIFCIVSDFLAENVFFSKSFDIIRVFYLKGLPQKNLIVIPFIEHILFRLFVIIAIEIPIMKIIPIGSKITYIYYAIPLMTSLTVLLSSLLKNLWKCRERSVRNEHIGS